MKDTHFGAAFWGYSWDDAYNKNDSELGTANLIDNSIVLNLPFGELLGSPGVVNSGPKTKPEQSDYLYAFSQDGYRLVIRDAYSLGFSRHIPGGTNQKIGGSYLLAGRQEFNPLAGVEEIRLRLLGLKEWVARSPIGLQIDAETGKFEAITYDLENEESYDITLLENESISIGVQHLTAVSCPICGDVSIKHDCQLSIIMKHHLDFKEAFDVATDVARFLSFCMGFAADIQELELRFEGCESFVHCYFSLNLTDEHKPADYRCAPFKLTDIEESVETYLNNWLNAIDGLRSSRDIVTSLMTYRWEMPIDLRFIAAAQALESLTRVNADLLSLSEDEYERRVRIIKESIADKDTLEWIKGRVSQNRKGQRRLLREFCDRYSTYSGWLVEDTKAFIDINESLRNGYTHRDTGIMSSSTEHYEQLRWHTECLLLLSYGVIWQLLGMDAEYVIKRLEQSCFCNQKIYEIRKRYKKK